MERRIWTEINFNPIGASMKQHKKVTFIRKGDGPLSQVIPSNLIWQWYKGSSYKINKFLHIKTKKENKIQKKVPTSYRKNLWFITVPTSAISKPFVEIPKKHSSIKCKECRAWESFFLKNWFRIEKSTLASSYVDI